jgi:hypothetical protein
MEHLGILTDKTRGAIERLEEEASGPRCNIAKIATGRRGKAIAAFSPSRDLRAKPQNILRIS